MQAYVYKSQRKQDTFVYLAKRDDFSRLPPSLELALAPFAFVLEVALTAERRLARADAAQVRQSLSEQGFYLQMPPPPVPPVPPSLCPVQPPTPKAASRRAWSSTW